MDGESAVGCEGHWKSTVYRVYHANSLQQVRERYKSNVVADRAYLAMKLKTVEPAVERVTFLAVRRERATAVSAVPMMAALALSIQYLVWCVC